MHDKRHFLKLQLVIICSVSKNIQFALITALHEKAILLSQ